jgi:hypothetical protein
VDAEGIGRGGAAAQAEKRGPRGASGGEDRASGGHGVRGADETRQAAGGEAEWSGSARQVSEQSRVHVCGAGDEERSGVDESCPGRKPAEGCRWNGLGGCGRRRADVERSWSCRRTCPTPAEIRLEVGLLDSSEVVCYGTAFGEVGLEMGFHRRRQARPWAVELEGRNLEIQQR